MNRSTLRLGVMLAFLLPAMCLAQDPGVGLDTLPGANPLGGGELLFGYQAGSGGSGANVCARGWCPVTVTPAQIKTYVGSGTGTLTGITVTAPASTFAVTGSPCVTGGCNIGLIFATQSANTIFAGPASGIAAAPTWRLQVAADLPLFSNLGAGSSLAGPECMAMTQAAANLCTTPAALLTYINANLTTITYPGLGATSGVNGPSDLLAEYNAADTALEKVSVNGFKFRSPSASCQPATATSVTVNADTCDVVWMNMTGSSATFTVNNPTGTPVGGQIVEFLLETTNTQTMAYGGNVIQGTCLSTSSGSSKSDWLQLKWNPLSSKWNCKDDGHNY